MHYRRTSWFSILQRLAIFAVAFVLVIIFFMAIDDFSGARTLYLLRTGNFETLITVMIISFILHYVLKKLLILQWKWGVER